MNTVISKVNKKHNKTNRVYCKIGDKLTILADHVDVLIVENESKERFSIHINDIEYETGKVQNAPKQTVQASQNTQGKIDF